MNNKISAFVLIAFSFLLPFGSFDPVFGVSPVFGLIDFFSLLLVLYALVSEDVNLI